MASSKFRIKKGTNLQPQAAASNSTTGDLEVLASTGKLNYHNGSTSAPVLTTTSTDTVTNKSIDADANTITNIENSDIKDGAGIDASKIADGSVSSTEFQYLNAVTGDIQAQINAKEPTVTKGNLTEATSSVLTIVGGTGAVIGSGTSVQVKQASTSQSGYLSDTDWNTFNNKQAAGNYITALTGDVSAAGPGSVAGTIANDAVTNAKMANMAAWTLKARNNAASGDPEDVALADLTETTSPATADFIVGMLSTGELRKYKLNNLPANSNGVGKYQMYDSTPQSIAAAGTITLDSTITATLQVRRVQGNTSGSEITASTTPFGTGSFVDGLSIRLVGVNDDQPLVIANNDAAKGCLLNGNMILLKGSSIELLYDSTSDRFREISRTE